MRQLPSPPKAGSNSFCRSSCVRSHLACAQLPAGRTPTSVLPSSCWRSPRPSQLAHVAGPAAKVRGNARQARKAAHEGHKAWVELLQHPLAKHLAVPACGRWARAAGRAMSGARAGRGRRRARAAWLLHGRRMEAAATPGQPPSCQSQAGAVLLQAALSASASNSQLDNVVEQHVGDGGPVAHRPPLQRSSSTQLACSSHSPSHVCSTKMGHVPMAGQAAAGHAAQAHAQTQDQMQGIWCRGPGRVQRTRARSLAPAPRCCAAAAAPAAGSRCLQQGR